MAVLLSSIAGGCLLAHSARAGTPVFTNSSRDLLLTFRKTGLNASANNFEIDLGQASLYYSAAAGTRKAVSQYTPAQLLTVFGDLNNLSWSVGGFVEPLGDSGDPSIPNGTLWATVPRFGDGSTQSPSPGERSPNAQNPVANQMNSILTQASFYSGSVAADPNNNASDLIVIPTGSGFEAGAFLGSFGNYKNDFWSAVENTTSATFDSDGIPSRSDFYQLEPTHSGTTPPGTYLGYFELETDGSMNFVVPSAAPAGPTLSISVANGIQSISFPTVANATYTLHYTDAAGLTSPVGSWNTVSTNIVGNGSVESFQQNSTDTTRFYTVSVQ